TASAVRKTPYATHGCRPVSVTIQPQITATNPIHQTCCAGHRYQRAVNKRPRHHSHAPVRPVRIISRPMPTMARKAKKGGRTGGRSFGAKFLRPRNRPSQPTTFDQMAQSIAGYEASAEVTTFTSKFDAVQAGKAQFTPQEQLGYEVFRGKGQCNACHRDGGP